MSPRPYYVFTPRPGGGWTVSFNPVWWKGYAGSRADIPNNYSFRWLFSHKEFRDV